MLLAARLPAPLQVLKWCRLNGCVWNGQDCANKAAMGGHSDVLEWCMTQGRQSAFYPIAGNNEHTAFRH